MTSPWKGSMKQARNTFWPMGVMSAAVPVAVIMGMLSLAACCATAIVGLEVTSPTSATILSLATSLL